jgi:flagellar biosynthesis GTPase FlhF
MTKEHRERYFQSEEYKEYKRQDEEFERKRQEEKKIKRKESNQLKQKYTKKERQEYAKKEEDEQTKIRELKKLELEKIEKIKQEQQQESNRIVKEREMKNQEKTDNYYKAEYLFYKLFDTIEKQKLANFDLYKDYNLLLPIYNDFKKYIPSGYCPPYNQRIPQRYILEKYFTPDKIQEIKQFEIFNDKEIEELIDIFMYKPKTFGYKNM